MKIGKRLVNKPSSKLLVFKRDDGDIALEFVAVTDRSQFDAICKPPVPPKMIVKGGGKVPDYESPVYQAQLEAHGRLYTQWMMLKTIKAAADTPDGEPTEIEWDRIRMNDPKTWSLFDDELKVAFSEVERMVIIRTITEVNSIGQEMLDEARAAFLLRRQSPPEESTSQTGEQGSTPFSEPANDSESVPQT